MSSIARPGLVPRFLCSLALAPLFAAGASGEVDRAAEERVKQALSKVAVPFVANSGQTDPSVAYYAETFSGPIFVTKDGKIVYSLPGKRESGAKAIAGKAVPPPAGPGWSLTESAMGGKARPTATDKTSTRFNYFSGNDPACWKIDLPTYAAVSLGEVWPGVSLDLKARGRSVEKLFTVEPGADPSRIRMRMTGARSLRLNEAGGMVARTGLGDVTFTPPSAYQERRGARQPVQVAYIVKGREYGFRVSGQDPTLPVVIDPLVQSTYLGGNGSDSAGALAIHPTSGDVYVGIDTTSSNFPGTTGGAQAPNAVSRVVIAKFPFIGSSAGASDAAHGKLHPELGPEFLVKQYFDTLSGLADSFIYDEKLRLGQLGHFSSGQAASAEGLHVAGQAASTDGLYVAGLTKATNFPGTAGGAQATNGGGFDGFISLLDPDSGMLIQSTYLGGSGSDSVNAMAIHPTSGDLYVASGTTSTNFPGTTGAAQATNGGGYDAFAARLTPDLKTLKKATYLGGSGDDYIYALAIHPTGDLYLAGQTASTNFPGTTGAAQGTYGGGTGPFGTDAFVARLTADLTLTRATYLGGSGNDSANALAIHPVSGDVYLAGQTDSTNLPGTTGGAQAAKGGGTDAFAARLTADLTTLTRATYLGGSGFDVANALAIHRASGDVYVAGQTGSTNFPGTAGGVQPGNGGSDDAFAARLTADLMTLTRATYLGGSGSDGARALAIHPISGDVYVAGQTASTNFPGTAGGAQPAHAADNGSTDAFVARLTGNLAPSGCSATLTALCLNDFRFRVQVQWTTPQGQTGAGQAVTLTSDTGYFWFFSANNVEMVLKVVDGRPLNNRFWVFAGGLTNVNVVITVTDTLTGTIKTYTNPQNTAFQPIQDTAAFAGATTPDTSGIVPTDSYVATAAAAEAADVLRSYAHPASPASLLNLRPLLDEAACAPNATTLCLNSSRFKVQAQWTTPQGQSGTGQAVGLTGDTGYFWFFSSNNVEMVLKVVDGRALNNSFWVFAGGLTNVSVVITVTDTQTGVVKTYTNPQGTAFQPIQDTSAFSGP